KWDLYIVSQCCEKAKAYRALNQQVNQVPAIQAKTTRPWSNKSLNQEPFQRGTKLGPCSLQWVDHVNEVSVKLTLLEHTSKLTQRSRRMPQLAQELHRGLSLTFT
ncbi:Hypothetical predicted protein, partial [Paramuricea clavata]